MKIRIAMSIPGLLLLAVGGCTPTDTVTPPPPPPPPPPGPVAVQLVEVARNVGFPLFVTAPPGDQSRLFIVDKGGRIRIVKNGSLLSQPFLDIANKVSGGDEQGLLGLAFHPNFASNGRFIVDYTDLAGTTRVAVYRVGANPDLADPASEQVILSIDQPFANHNGGMVVFGPDGQLYIGSGDGGSGGDPQGNGQNRTTLLGKILRVTVNDDGQLSIPADNPFAGQSSARNEIWSYGLRNPWRFSFDRQNGNLYIADVGQANREEIDVATQTDQFGKGANYGWNQAEGTGCYSSNCNPAAFTLPVLDYTHADGCSITGGYVYRGAAVPALVGLYFYSDYCRGWIRSFRLASGAASERKEWTELATGGRVTSFGEDARGELYVMTTAVVYRIAPVP